MSSPARRCSHAAHCLLLVRLPSCGLRRQQAPQQGTVVVQATLLVRLIGYTEIHISDEPSRRKLNGWVEPRREGCCGLCFFKIGARTHVPI
jgi:hypothetical protein